jgi:hypothetical protein
MKAITRTYDQFFYMGDETQPPEIRLGRPKVVDIDPKEFESLDIESAILHNSAFEIAAKEDAALLWSLNIWAALSPNVVASHYMVLLTMLCPALVGLVGCRKVMKGVSHGNG